MTFDTQQLRELLVGGNHISVQQFDAAAKLASERGVSVPEALITDGIISELTLGPIIAGTFGVPFLDLRASKIDWLLFDDIPEVVARTRGIIVVNRRDDGVIVGMVDPTDAASRLIVEKRLGETIIPHLVFRRALEETIAQHRMNIGDAITALVQRFRDVAVTREQRDEIIVQLLDSILQYAHQSRASDIHIEPHEERVAVRLRLDGVMHDVFEFPPELMDPLHTRVKVLAGLRTDVHLNAQDGKLRFRTESGTADARVSIIPVTKGENIVIRLLESKGQQFELLSLGFSDRDYTVVEQAIHASHGMILVTGPTGSGKTTTLYSVLKVLNRREVHIVTIEDPVEYDIDDITQIQVNAQAGLTFASGLRAIVRQDPNIIMVGEIRDVETADIAVNAALTGHLVLSTLHTNDAATTLPRLLEMNVEPFLIASTVNVVIAQRLVRHLCEHCRVPTMSETDRLAIVENPHLEDLLKQKSRVQSQQPLYSRGEGCAACNRSGYRGRLGIFEVLVMSEAIRELVVKRATSAEIMKTAIAEGMTTMLEDGVAKVIAGVTTIGEVVRTTKER